MTATPRDTTDDDILALLGHRRRRAVLQYLRGRTACDRLDVDSLGSAIASMEAADEHGNRESATSLDTAVDTADVDRVVVTLVHVHLPKLADAGAVEYDRDAGTVRFLGVPASAADSLRRVEWLAGELAGAADPKRAPG